MQLVHPSAKTAHAAIMSATVMQSPGVQLSDKPYARVSKMASGTKATLEIDGYIGGLYDWWNDTEEGKSASTFKKEIKALGAVTELDVLMNSGGGLAHEGAEMYVALEALKATGVKITMIIGALCASAATLPAMAADEVRISDVSLFMIHDPATTAWGTADELLKAASYLEKTKASAVEAYAKKNAKLAKEEIATLMAAETWYTGPEAVEAGWADTLVNEPAETKMSAPQGLATMSVDKAPEHVRERVASLLAAKSEIQEDPAPEAQPVVDETPADPMVFLQQQVAALATTVSELKAALTAEPRDEPEPVPDNSAAIANLRALAKADGKEAAFVEAVAAGKSLDELRAVVLAASGEKPKLTTVAVTDPSAQPTPKTPVTADAYTAFNTIPTAAARSRKRS